LEQHLKTDTHAIGWSRVNEQVKHQKAFQEAFQCKNEDPLFLKEEQRIQIW